MYESIVGYYLRKEKKKKKKLVSLAKRVKKDFVEWII